MKVILTPNMARELLENEQLIKNQEGPYSPQFRVKGVIPGVNLPVMGYVPVIKCWPLEPLTGKFPQEREVIPGMEDEVDDICMAKIDKGTISYKVNRFRWNPSFNPFTKVMESATKLDAHSILIYTPTFENDTIFLSAPTLNQLYEKMREYHIVNDTEDEDRKKGRMSMASHFNSIDEWFKKFQGICTYILFEGEDVVKCGTFENKRYW